MAQASHKDRLIRKLKRELKITYKLLEFATAQRDQARLVANALGRELEKKEGTEQTNDDSTKTNRPD